jgi:hypothetical protein
MSGRAHADEARGVLRAARELLSTTTWGDRALVVALLALGMAGALLAPPAARGAAVVVRVAGREVARAPLAREARVVAEGRLGPTEISVRDDAARIVAAPCGGKACIRMGAVSRAGQVIVCVPNDVVVEVEGAGEGGFDAILR